MLGNWKYAEYTVNELILPQEIVIELTCLHALKLNLLDLE